MCCERRVCQQQFLLIMKNHLNFCYLDDGKRSIIFRFSDTAYDKWASCSIHLSQWLRTRGPRVERENSCFESKDRIDQEKEQHSICLCMSLLFMHNKKKEENLSFNIRGDVNSLQTRTVKTFPFIPRWKNFFPPFFFSRFRKFCFVLTKTESQAALQNDKWA